MEDHTDLLQGDLDPLDEGTDDHLFGCPVDLRHILLVLDQAGWHTGKEVSIPEGIELVPLPSPRNCSRPSGSGR